MVAHPVASLVAGVVLGALARVLRHDSEDPGGWRTLVVGVVGGVGRERS